MTRRWSCWTFTCPGIDGLQTAELIRGREKSRDIPIIFLTANTTGHAHLSRGYSLGAVDYIVKPVDPAILRSKVTVFVELFKKTPRGGASGATAQETETKRSRTQTSNGCAC